MSQSKPFDFTQFVPGFDYLKNLTPGGAGAAAAPGWVAPTLDPEELDKRIQELKTVQFWLEQNAKAVAATVQALEVQRMTLATLKGMNMSFHDLAESLKVKPAEAPAPKPAAPKAKRSSTQPNAPSIDPAHWWGALTDQFQQIANKAMADIAHAQDIQPSAQPRAAAAKKTAAPKASVKASAKKTATKTKR